MHRIAISNARLVTLIDGAVQLRWSATAAYQPAAAGGRREHDGPRLKRDRKASVTETTRQTGQELAIDGDDLGHVGNRVFGETRGLGGDEHMARRFDESQVST